MRYQQPFGVTDIDAPYINGNPAIGQQGSIPPAAAFEFPQRELIAMIEAGGYTPTDDDLQQLMQAIRSQFVNYGSDAGVANQVSCGFSPPIQAYSLGMPFRIRIAATNTGASSFDAGAGRHPIKHIDGSDLAAGDMPAGGMVELSWDGTNFQMINFLGQGGGGPGTITNYNIKIPYIADTSSTSNAIVAPFVPAITSVQAGDPIEVKVKNNVTGPTTIYVNALSPVPVINRFGGPLRPWDIAQNEIVLLIYTGAAWQLIAHEPTTQTVIFSTPGTYNWVCPNGVYFLKSAEVWGAGSSGFNSTVGALSVSPGGTCGPGGNAGGYCAKFNMPVVPGTGYQVIVGAGGAPNFNNASNPGGASAFGTNSLTATGGAVVRIPYSPSVNPSGVNSWHNVGQGSGGDINAAGGPGFACSVLTGVLGWNGTYGFGGNAPRGGCGGGPFNPGSWPGGAGGGGAYYGFSGGSAGNPQSGQGADGGVILKF